MHFVSSNACALCNEAHVLQQRHSFRVKTPVDYEKYVLTVLDITKVECAMVNTCAVKCNAKHNSMLHEDFALNVATTGSIEFVVSVVAST